MILFISFFLSINLYAKIEVIIIDPGHGGKDPGAVDKKLGLQEKDINLEIAIYLKSFIETKMPFIKVVMTRKDDTFLSLEERTKIANSYISSKAIFVSIHTNSSVDKKNYTEGIEVFYYDNSLEKIEESRMNEIKNSDTKNFSNTLQDPISIMINEKLKVDSKALGENIAESLSIKSKEPIRRVAANSFFVVSYPMVPSVLVEVGFIMNKKITEQQYKKKLAKGIFQGILSFLKKESKF
ncbi:MAG: hypothetical protein A2Y41_08070 [Spirochaetes bacterium GWB1_36_13]|nr:MAG: hypothetical protein A2Y41_08070 [Spirochaetes bacterium GWB1_36_13]